MYSFTHCKVKIKQSRRKRTLKFSPYIIILENCKALGNDRQKVFLKKMDVLLPGKQLKFKPLGLGLFDFNDWTLPHIPEKVLAKMPEGPVQLVSTWDSCSTNSPRGEGRKEHWSKLALLFLPVLLQHQAGRKSPLLTMGPWRFGEVETPWICG